MPSTLGQSGGRAHVYRCDCCGQVLFSYDPSSGVLTIRCSKGVDTTITLSTSMQVETRIDRGTARAPR